MMGGWPGMMGINPKFPEDERKDMISGIKKEDANQQ
jgi:hypothetical protein